MTVFQYYNKAKISGSARHTPEMFRVGLLQLSLAIPSCHVRG